jgi:small subunit ribosomal protein S5
VFGLKDIGSKVDGSCNPMNVVKSVFKALGESKTPQEIAKMRGLKVEDVINRYYGE